MFLGYCEARDLRLCYSREEMDEFLVMMLLSAQLYTDAVGTMIVLFQICNAVDLVFAIFIMNVLKQSFYFF